MNEQDRLVKVAPLRPGVDERDVDASGRKMFKGAPQVIVLHRRSRFVG